jgi:ketosteroid isomerase-like protein
MYGVMVRRRVRRVFERLSAGDYEVVLAGLSADVHHRFAGDHPLGGERHDREAVRLWFERLFRLFPSLRFTVTKVAVSGWPWDLTAAVEWRADVEPMVGPGYVNAGAHVLRLRRGRVVSLHAYEDSQAVARACAVMAERGVTEAAAPPIMS